MTHFSPRLVTLALVGASLALGCSTTPAPKSAHDVAPPNTEKATQAQATPPPNTEDTTTVAIDDKILQACHISADKAYFDFDSSKLRSPEIRPLDAVAECFTHGALQGRSVKLVGRADPRGDTEYNFVLGQSRADQVGAVLQKAGLAPSRMTSTSRGELDAKGQDEPGWSKDRRVDVLLGS